MSQMGKWARIKMPKKDNNKTDAKLTFCCWTKKNRTNFNDAPMAMTKKRNKPAKNIRKLLNRLWVRSITAVLITTVNHLLGDAVFLHLIIFVLILCHRQKSNLDSRFTLLLDLRVWFWSHFDCFCAILIYIYFFFFFFVSKSTHAWFLSIWRMYEEITRFLFVDWNWQIMQSIFRQISRASHKIDNFLI